MGGGGHKGTLSPGGANAPLILYVKKGLAIGGFMNWLICTSTRYSYYITKKIILLTLIMLTNDYSRWFFCGGIFETRKFL